MPLYKRSQRARRNARDATAPGPGPGPAVDTKRAQARDLRHRKRLQLLLAARAFGVETLHLADETSNLCARARIRW
jgi:hypothetical protein